MSMSRIAKVALIVAGLLVPAPDRGMANDAPTADDRFIAGYAAAVLSREYHVPQASILVRNGTLMIDGAAIDEPTRQKIQASLSAAPGVRSVEILDRAAFAQASGAGPALPAEAAGPGPVAVLQPPAAAEAEVAQGLQILPRSVLFKPLRADPRWPHFSASYQYWQRDRDVTHAGTASFGETIPFVRNSGLGGQWEFGVQAGVFAIFDLASDSANLINADYFVGLPLSYRRGDFSFMFRPYHQSSHLGDEYILTKGITKAQRVNLSYEALNALASYDIGPAFRVYGGAGWLFDTDPGDLKRWMGQVGAEYRGREVWWNTVRPVVAADLQFWQEHSWRPNASLRAGLEFENFDILTRRILIAAEYYNGHNPNGQFLTRDLQFVGIGLHAFVE